MLFGNRERFGIEIHPLNPTWERKYLPERTAWGAVSIWVDGANLCRHSVAGTDTIDEYLNVPLAPIADWIVRSWLHILFEERPRSFPAVDRPHDALRRWGDVPAPANVSDDEWVDAREEWWSRHFISAGADGAILPSIALTRQDERLLVDWSPPQLSGEEVTFLNPHGSHNVEWRDAEETLDRFVTYVGEWLRSDGLESIFPWAHFQNPLLEQPKSLMVAFELYTGRTQAELYKVIGADSLASLRRVLGLPEDSNDPGGSPLTQVLRDLPPRLPEGARAILAELDAATRRDPATGIASLRQISFDASRSAEHPERAGQLAAGALRREFGLDGQPLVDTRVLLSDIGIAVSLSEERDIGRMVTGMRSEGGAGAIILNSTRTSVEWGRRFEMARALGHLLLDQVRSGALGAAASSFTADRRRRRSGAFAAELLLPESALQAASDGKLDGAAEHSRFQPLLERYGVGARTAAYQLWNHRLLSSTDVREELIEAFAATD